MADSGNAASTLNAGASITVGPMWMLPQPFALPPVQIRIIPAVIPFWPMLAVRLAGSFRFVHSTGKRQGLGALQARAVALLRGLTGSGVAGAGGIVFGKRGYRFAYGFIAVEILGALAERKRYS